MSIAYRARQFWRLLRARPLPGSGWTTIEAILSPSEVALFRRQSEGDQAHAFRVAQTLLDAGETDKSLLAAALLHDAGKCQVATTILDRVVGTLGERLFPEHASRWGMTAGDDWRKPFVIRKQHAQWGAALASKAGSDRMTVRLILRHQDAPDTLQDAEARRLLTRLQWADDQH